MCNRITILAACLALTLATLAAVWAAPVLPPRRQALPGEIQSLTALRQVRLAVNDFSKPIHDAGIREIDILNKSRKELLDNQLEVVDDEQSPLLMLRVEMITEPNMPKIVTLAFFLEVQQKVKLIRMNDQEMVVPTTTLYVAGISAPEDMGRGVDWELKQLYRSLGKAVDLASRGR